MSQQGKSRPRGQTEGRAEELVIELQPVQSHSEGKMEATPSYRPGLCPFSRDHRAEAKLGNQELREIGKTLRCGRVSVSQKSQQNLRFLFQEVTPPTPSAYPAITQLVATSWGRTGPSRS